MCERIFYCSDHHFFHDHILETGRSSTFIDVEDMNEKLVLFHNEVVRNDDIVFFLGDIIFTNASQLDERLAETVGRMHGKKYLILGNHDHRHKNHESFSKYFLDVTESRIIWDNERSVHLYHYPILSWWNKQRGAYHVHGHLHGNRELSELEILRHEEKALSACLDVNDFRPAQLDDLISNNQRWKLL